MLEQFQHMIQINKKYYTVVTVSTYNRNMVERQYQYN